MGEYADDYNGVNGIFDEETDSTPLNEEDILDEDNLPDEDDFNDVADLEFDD